MAQLKYVAAGFTTDSGLLLSDFIRSNSLDFTVFAELWKAKNFSLVYMGRSSESELTEFTQEIFGLSAGYLTTETSVNARVGAVYLLYALFRNQILDPPLRIRMVREQFEVVANIRRSFDGPEHKTLRYVIDYLCEYGVDWVACPTLVGPMVNRGKPTVQREPVNNNRELGPTAMADLKSNLMDLDDTKALQKLNDLSAEYVKVKSSMTVAIDSGFNACRRLGEFTSRLRDLVMKDPLETCSRRPRGYCRRMIGARRTRLKLKAMGQQLSEGDSDRDGSWKPRRRGSSSKTGKVTTKKPVKDSGCESLSKAEVLGRFNKRKKPKSFRYDANYWAPANDSESVSKDTVENSYWYKNDNVIDDMDGSDSEDVDTPKPVESADEVEVQSVIEVED